MSHIEKTPDDLAERNDMADSHSGGFRLDLTINPAMVGGLLLQTALVVWWIAGLNSRVIELERSEVHASASIDKLNDAREDFRLNVQALTSAIESQRSNLIEKTERFNQIQEALSRIERGNIDARNARIKEMEEKLEKTNR